MNVIDILVDDDDRTHKFIVDTRPEASKKKRMEIGPALELEAGTLSKKHRICGC